jgi:hypothetical protein
VKELYENGVVCPNTGRRKNVHDEERSGPPSLVSDDLVQSVDQNISDSRLLHNIRTFV